MARYRSLHVLVLALLLAGCASPSDTHPPDAPPGQSRVEIDEARPSPTFGEVKLGASAAPDTAATLGAAPKLVEGEWWRIELHSPIDGLSSEFVRVVAKVEDDAYIIGMPHEGWWKEAVIYHTPAFGEVSRADLSYSTHNVPFTPLRFPLVDGDTWETDFSGVKMNATVTVESPTVAKVSFTAPAGGPMGALSAIGQQNGETVVMELTYDATIHEVVELKYSSVTYRVIDHGYGFEGWVTVPRGEQLVFFHGRIGPALDLAFQPAIPSESVAIAGGFNRVTFLQVVQAVGPGSYRTTATSPTGEVYSTEITGAPGFTTSYWEAADPDGEWQIDHLVGGVGFVFIEGIAYHQYDIRLPDGAIRSDHSHEVVR